MHYRTTVMALLFVVFAFSGVIAWANVEPSVEPKKILMVLTSHEELLGSGKKTGFWYEEMSTPYYEFTDQGHDVTIASIRGGNPPADPRSIDKSIISVQRFMTDPIASEKLMNSVPLTRIKPEEYDAIFLPGGHGTLWDFAGEDMLISRLNHFMQEGKPVGALCHAPVILLDLPLKDGKPQMSGRKVTSFTKAEENAIGLSNFVPSFVDKQLIAQGAKFESSDNFLPHVVRDGNLVTGQNPASSEATAELFLKVLNGAVN